MPSALTICFLKTTTGNLRVVKALCSKESCRQSRLRDCMFYIKTIPPFSQKSENTPLYTRRARGGSQKAIEDCRFRGDSSPTAQNDSQINYPLITNLQKAIKDCRVVVGADPYGLLSYWRSELKTLLARSF